MTTRTRMMKRTRKCPPFGLHLSPKWQQSDGTLVTQNGKKKETMNNDPVTSAAACKHVSGVAREEEELEEDYDLPCMINNNNNTDKNYHPRPSGCCTNTNDNISGCSQTMMTMTMRKR